MSGSLKVSVLITSYNYRHFIEETIESVLNQTRAADEIIIVDDGSTDGSCEFVSDKYKNVDRVTVISKKNGGQLSAINHAYLRSTGDIICFIDSDDIFEPSYLENICNIYNNNSKIDYISCAYREFGDRNGVVSRYSQNADLGLSALGVYYGNIWTSGPTVTISVRRRVLEKYFPVPFESDWVISPDACISWGASLVGAHKFFCALPLVRYRIHGKNAHLGDKRTDAERYVFLYKKNRFFTYVLNKNCINVDKLLSSIAYEFQSILSAEARRKVRIKYLKVLIRNKFMLFDRFLAALKILF